MVGLVCVTGWGWWYVLMGWYVLVGVCPGAFGCMCLGHVLGVCAGIVFGEYVLDQRSAQPEQRPDPAQPTD